MRKKQGILVVLFIVALLIAGCSAEKIARPGDNSNLSENRQNVQQNPPNEGQVNPAPGNGAAAKDVPGSNRDKKENRHNPDTQSSTESPDGTPEIKKGDTPSGNTSEGTAADKTTSREETVPTGQPEDKTGSSERNWELSNRGTPVEHNSTSVRYRNGHAANMQVLAFYTNPEQYLPGSYPTLMRHADKIDWVAPFWFRLDPEKKNGHIELFRFQGETDFGPKEAKEVIKEAQAKGVKVLALIHNLLYGSTAKSKQLAHEMVATKQGRTNFLHDLQKLLEEYGFDGINMDVEHFPLEDRDKFSSLMKEIYTTLKPKGYTITISVPAKTGDDRSNSWSAPFDYGALGKYADLVLLMTYDEHGYVSGPGPIASIEWDKAVLNYATTKIPAKKILLGIPAYGFDWTAGGRYPKYLSYQLAMEIARQQQKAVQWDNAAKVPYFTYWDENNRRHEVWFENASSLSHKLELVEQYGIAGIGIWRIGMEDPQFWSVIKYYFEK